MPFTEGRISDGSITIFDISGEQKEIRHYKDGKLDKINFFTDIYHDSYEINFIDGKPHGIVTVISGARNVYLHGLSFGILGKNCFMFNGYCVNRLEIRGNKETFYNRNNKKTTSLYEDSRDPIKIYYDKSGNINLVKESFWGMQKEVYFYDGKPRVMKKYDRHIFYGGYIFRDDGIEEFSGNGNGKEAERQFNDYVHLVLGIDLSDIDEF